MQQQLKIEPLATGAKNHYAAALNVENVMGWKNINHSGATASYASYLEAFPELGLSFAIINNTSEFFITEPVEKVRKILVADKSVKLQPIKGIKLPDASLDRFTGMFISLRDGDKVEVKHKDDHLEINNRNPLTALSTNVFKSNDQTFIFNNTGLKYVSGDGDTIRFIKVTLYKPTSKDLKFYCGNYSSDETSSIMQISNVNGELTMKINPEHSYKLTPTYKDVFDIDRLGNLQFVRDSYGQVVTIKINVERARGIIYQRSNKESFSDAF